MTCNVLDSFFLSKVANQRLKEAWPTLSAAEQPMLPKVLKDRPITPPVPKNTGLKNMGKDAVKALAVGSLLYGGYTALQRKLDKD